MPTITYVPSASATIILKTRDEHCPAHVHAISRNNNWEIKILFSYAGNDVQHLTYEILYGIPLRKHVNAVITEVNNSIYLCRKEWWNFFGDVCLINQTLLLKQGVVTKKNPPNGPKVLSAKYLPSNQTVIFTNQNSSTVLIGKCQ